MDDKTFLTGICPRCKHTINIPPALDSFSCVYCGARLTPAELLSPEDISADMPDTEQQRLFTSLRDTLPCAITDHLGVFKFFTKKAYPKHFSAYLEQYRGQFQSIAALCGGLSGEPIARELAEQVVAQLGQWAEANRKGLASTESMLNEIKYTLCLLTIPAIRSVEHIGCEDFCRALHEAWLQAYPKNDFQIVSYSQITDGFRSRKLCYITTATCRQAGKPDDCDELTAFRAFRDGYLSRQPDGAGLIAQYYDIAPGVVMSIDFCHDPDTVYPAVWSEHLSVCYEALRRGDNAACKEAYTAMVQALSRQYLC